MKWITNVFSRSLPARLLLIFVGVGIAMILILAITFSLGLSGQWRSNIKPHLVQYLDYVNTDIGNPPDLSRAQDLASRLPINIYITGPGVDFSSTGQVLDLTGVEFTTDERRKRRSWPDHIKSGDHHDRTVLRSQLGEYQVYYELKRRAHQAHRHSVFLTALAILMGLLWLCFRLIRRQLRPVQAIQTGVGQMGQGNLSYRIKVERDDDLGELSTSINSMATDIQQMLDAKRQLLLGISHELRSPLTRARISTELLPESSHRSRLIEDLTEMESLVTDILESERLNSRHGVLHRSAVQLGELVHSVVTEAHFDGVRVDDRTDGAIFNIDEARVRLLLRNLIGNAVLYSPDAPTPPTVRVETILEDPSTDNADNHGVNLVVTDCGKGISEDAIAQLTQPFYRVDPSRSRHTGGFGLGLYLSRLICEAHGGSLTIDSSPGRGTRVTARLLNVSETA